MIASLQSEPPVLLPPMTAGRAPSARPLFACDHCGLPIQLAQWPPVQPLLAGPCPSCGEHISCDVSAWITPPAVLPQFDLGGALEFGQTPTIAGPEPTRGPGRFGRTGAHTPRFVSDRTGLGERAEVAAPGIEKSRSGRPSVPKSEVWLHRALLALGVAAAGVVVVALHPPRLAAPPVAPMAAEAADPEEMILPAENALIEAQQTLAKLATAKSGSDALPWVLAPERVESFLAAAYAHGRGQPALDPLLFQPRPVKRRDLNRGILILRHDEGPARGLLLFLKKDPGEGAGARYRLDWESFQQENTGWLETFAASPRPEPALFRAVLERRHVFDGGETRPGCMAVRLRTLRGLVLERNALIDPSSPVFAQLAEALPWNTLQLATVTLAWTPPAAGAEPVLTIAAFHCLELAGVGGSPTEPLPSPFASQAPQTLSANQ